MSLLAERGAGPDTGGSGLRVEPLGEPDRAELVALIEADPLVNVVAAARVRGSRVLSPDVIGSLLGVRARDGELRAAVLDAGNLLPIGGGPAEWAELAVRLGQAPRACSSIVGRVEAVTALWDVLAPRWGSARAVRAAQPLLVLDREHCPPAEVDVVRPMRMLDLDAYVPAAAAMFHEELGIEPTQATTAAEYRRRVAALIAARRAFGVMRGGQVVFKADLGAVTAHTCQVQGVWVHPDLRGRGIATAAMAQVLRHALELAPTASLYVNDFNVPARRLYERLGMTEAAVLSTVLF